MKYFIGVDTSKFKIHIAVLDENSKIFKLDMLASTEKKDIERMWELKNLFEDWLIDFSNNNDVNVDDMVVTVEGSIMLQNPKTSFDIAKTINGIEMACCSIAAPCFEIQTTSWKKMVIGNGACKKEDIMKFAQTKWGKKVFSEQDYADAACIALHQFMLMSDKKRS